MGLLDKLWDDTLAGPRPDTGLGKLRKYPSMPSSSSSSTAGVPMITRSITILRPSSSIQRTISETDSLPSSPSSAPDSPLTPGTPRGDWRRLRRKPADGLETAEPRSPTAYDWVVISALDR